MSYEEFHPLEMVGEIPNSDEGFDVEAVVEKCKDFFESTRDSFNAVLEGAVDKTMATLEMLRTPKAKELAINTLALFYLASISHGVKQWIPEEINGHMLVQKTGWVNVKEQDGSYTGPVSGFMQSRRLQDQLTVLLERFEKESADKEAA